MVCSYTFHFVKFFYCFGRDRKGERERDISEREAGRERNINVREKLRLVVSACEPGSTGAEPGDGAHTCVCALSENRNSNLLVMGQLANQLSPTGQGSIVKIIFPS